MPKVWVSLVNLLHIFRTPIYIEKLAASNTDLPAIKQTKTIDISICQKFFI